MPKVNTQYPKALQIMLTNEQLKRVDKWAKEDDTNRSSLGRKILVKAIDAREKKQVKKRKK